MSVDWDYHGEANSTLRTLDTMSIVPILIPIIIQAFMLVPIPSSLQTLSWPCARVLIIFKFHTNAHTDTHAHPHTYPAKSMSFCTIVPKGLSMLMNVEKLMRAIVFVLKPAFF